LTSTLKASEGRLKMAEPKRDSTVSALEAIHAALKPLDSEERRRVLSSVYALLGMSDPPQVSPSIFQRASLQSSNRPLSLIELIKDKQPRTNIDRIAVFAYYRDQHEQKARFGRNDLKPYFAIARVDPPANYDRDFVEAVKRGWVHEDGDESYITSKGIEAVEGGFPADRQPSRAKRSAGKRTSPKAKSKVPSRKR
jgi:hypothetical protein